MTADPIQQEIQELYETAWYAVYNAEEFWDAIAKLQSFDVTQQVNEVPEEEPEEAVQEEIQLPVDYIDRQIEAVKMHLSRVHSHESRLLLEAKLKELRNLRGVEQEV